MQQNPLYLRRLRDFGEKINDSFLFLKQNWKKLLTMYAVFVVPFILIAIIIALFFANRLYSLLQFNAAAFSPYDFFTLDFFIIVFCFVLAGTIFNVAMFGYFKLYDEKNGEPPTVPEIGRLIVRKTALLLWYNFMLTITMVIVLIIPTMLLIFIPLINILALMLIVIIAFTFFLQVNCVYITEDLSFMDGIYRVFYLFRQRWWQVIGYTAVIFLIYYVFSAMVQFIFMLIFGISAINFLSPSDNTMMERSTVSWMVLGFGFLMLLQQVFYSILYSGIAINHYSLVEEKDGSAIEERIENIGNNTDPHSSIEEDY